MNLKSLLADGKNKKRRSKYIFGLKTENICKSVILLFVEYAVKHTNFPLPFVNLGLRIKTSFREVAYKMTN